jgi:hypothetical protein
MLLIFEHFYGQSIVFRNRRSFSTNNSCPYTIDIFGMIQFNFNIQLLSMKEPLLYGHYEKLFCSLETYEEIFYVIHHDCEQWFQNTATAASSEN